MNKKILASLFVIGVLITFSAPLASAEEEGDEPAWFPLLELSGAIIGIAATFITYKNYLGMKGGVVGTGFKFVTLALVLLTVGVILRGLNEQFAILGEFMGELIFELFIYAALISIALGSKKSYDMMKE